MVHLVHLHAFLRNSAWVWPLGPLRLFVHPCAGEDVSKILARLLTVGCLLAVYAVKTRH
jgi:hypothetical protein